MRSLLIIAPFLIGGALFVFLSKSEPSVPAQLQQEKEYSFEIADTPEERTLGLSGRTEVPQDGLLFVFPDAGSPGFWMKDMLISIDILWLGEDGTILGIEENVHPDTYPTSFYPPMPVRYVLETRVGFAEEVGWGIGSVVPLPK